MNNRNKNIRNIRVKHKWSSTQQHQKQIRINLNLSQQHTLKTLQDSLREKLNINVSSIVICRAALEMFVDELTRLDMSNEENKMMIINMMEGASKYE